MELTRKQVKEMLAMDTEPLAQLGSDIVLELADRAKEAEQEEETGKEEAGE